MGTRTDAKIARLARLLDVALSGIADNDLLFYDNATQKWENRAGFATETNPGTGRIATQAETNAGVLDNVFISPLKLATYVSGAIAGGVRFIGGYNATTNTPDLVTPAPGVVLKGDMYVVTVAGTFFGEALEIGDSLISKVDNPSALTDWIRVEKNVSLQDLASVLAQGNTTGANDIVIDLGQVLQVGAATERIYENTNYLEFDADGGFEFNNLLKSYGYIGLDLKNDAVLWIQDLINQNYATLNGSDLAIEFYKSGEFSLIISKDTQTADRAQTFQDADGVIALTSDIAANTVYFTTAAALLAYTDFRANSFVILNDPAFPPYTFNYVISTGDGTYGTTVFKTITNTQIKYFTSGAAFLAYTEYIPGSLVILNDPGNPYGMYYVVSTTDGTFPNTVMILLVDEDVILGNNILPKTLTGISFALSTDITAIDSILTAFGKLQAQSTLNNAKVTNATHTGEVTGATALTVDKTAITNKTTVTAVSGDFVLISDTSDSGNLKKVNASDFLTAGSSLATKSGIVASVSFTGTPKIAAVVFASAFADNLYSVTVTGEDSRNFTIQSKTSAGFTINANSNAALSGDTFWQAIKSGETA